MNALKQINHFLKFKSFAIVGVSRDPNKFGNVLYRTLKANGYQLYPVNPHVMSIDGQRCYRSVDELPSDIRHILIVLPSSEIIDVVKRAVNRGITDIWIQQCTSEVNDVIDYAKHNGVNIIQNECIFMHADPIKGVHKFHRFIWKSLGKLPK